MPWRVHGDGGLCTAEAESSLRYPGPVAFLTRLLRAGETKLVKRLGRIADHIETLEPEVQALTDAELRAKTDEFKKRYADGETLDELLPEAFAVAREEIGRASCRERV